MLVPIIICIGQTGYGIIYSKARFGQIEKDKKVFFYILWSNKRDLVESRLLWCLLCLSLIKSYIISNAYRDYSN